MVHNLETLAIISCFAPTDQDFSDRCTQLGDLVATGDGNAPGNADAALLCYLCACNVERVIGIWLDDDLDGLELAVSSKSSSSFNRSSNNNEFGIVRGQSATHSTTLQPSSFSSSSSSTTCNYHSFIIR